MKKILAMLMIAALLAAALSAVVYADEASDPALKDTAENVQDNLVTTHHTAMIQGQEIAYTAETGTMVLNTKGETCEIFYTAYTLDDVDDPAERPVTFAFNGGPGSCSMFLHVGCLGPRRLDGRIAGPTTSGSFEDGASDPSNAAFTLSYGDAYYNYIISELGFVTDDPYIPLNLDVNYGWTYPIGGEGGYLSQEQTIYKLLSDNDFLKIWVLCGYYDGATPFYEAEWVYNHVFLNAQNQDQISFTYYPSGHMIYMEKASFDKFRQDAEEWFLKD